MCKELQQPMRKLSDHFLATLQRHNYVTPTSYLEFFSTYKTLLSKKVGALFIYFAWTYPKTQKSKGSGQLTTHIRGRISYTLSVEHIVG